jgi:deazaflavin-dependent oxidoreductase (nitroreductase family)
MTFEDFERTMDDTSEIELTTTGRRSGHEISHPVWFVRQGETLYLLPVGGSDSQWYKNVLKTPRIRLVAGRAQCSVQAAPITDPTKVHEVVETFSAKYGGENVKAYYPKPDVAVEVPASDLQIAAAEGKS